MFLPFNFELVFFTFSLKLAFENVFNDHGSASNLALEAKRER